MFWFSFIITVFFSSQALASLPPTTVELTGKISADPGSPCSKGKMDLFVAEGTTRTLLYQVSVIPNGSFFFRLKDGKYEVRASAANGCEAISYLDLRPDVPTRNVNLALHVRKDEKK